MSLLDVKPKGKKPTRYYSDRQEKRIAESLEGRQTANSGATLLGGKGDVIVDNLLSIECKTKTKDSDTITIRKEWFEKMKEQNLIDHTRYDVLAFSFGPNQPNYYVIDENLFLDFVDFLKHRE